MNFWKNYQPRPNKPAKFNDDANMKVAIFIGIVVALAAVSFVYDIALALTHENVPRFYTAPGLFCSSRWAAVTLPPFGILICPDSLRNEPLRRHELVHWDQYKRFGTLGFYASYAYGWVRGGFSYNNWMEKEAAEKSGY